MSFFAVTIERIAEVIPHPNADRLDLVALHDLGYPIVVPRGAHGVGERILYFPIDSQIPAPLADRLGVRKYLGGPLNDRVKTVCLRGQPSQGLIAGLDVLENYGLTEDGTPAAITQALGVVKFVPPLKEIVGGRLVPLPDGLSTYDIENAERSADVLAFLMEREVVITEKLEGANLNATFVRATEDQIVCMRENAIHMEPGSTHVYVQAVHQGGLFAFARWLTRVDGRQASVYAEIVGEGFAGNYYQIPGVRVCVFDIRIDGRWLPEEDRLSALASFNAESTVQLDSVPVIFRGQLRDFLAGRTVREVSHGETSLDLPTLPGRHRRGLLREGLVIKPAAAARMPTSFARVVVKQRDPIYLAKTGN